MQSSISQAKKWSLFNRFRILFAVYFAFLILDFTSSDELFPHFVYEIMGFYTNFWHWIVPFTGQHILNLSYPITVKPNGSGDTTYNYVLQLLWIVFSVAIALAWAVIDRKRPSYRQFQYWSRIVIRYHLAYLFFVYGFVKVIKLQFPFPNLYRLTETFGEATPMGLAWTFIGYSSGYNIFIGGAEVLAGLLLFFKRTALFGALVGIMIMTNVFAMNMAYDIPVKLFSLNLIFMSIWIAWYDKDRLINFFFLNKSVAPAPIEYQFKTKWKKVVQLSLKTLVITFAFYATLYTNYQLSKEYGDDALKPPLYGIYNVDTFIQNVDVAGMAHYPDSVRWKRLIINSSKYARITTMNDSTTWMKLSVDTVTRKISFTAEKDTSNTFTLSYRNEDHIKLEAHGIMQGKPLQIRFSRVDLNQLPLIKTGFHWINEYPNNS